MTDYNGDAGDGWILNTVTDGSPVYTVNTTNTTNLSGQRATYGDSIVYLLRRAYMKFDLSSYGLTLASISSVQLILNVSTVVSSASYNLTSDTIVDNWGDTLQNNAADFDSTDTNNEDTQAISTTGTKTFTCNKNNLNLSGTVYYRIRCTNEYPEEDSNTSITFSSQNNLTVGNRPILRITLTSGVVLQIIEVSRNKKMTTVWNP